MVLPKTLIPLVLLLSLACAPRPLAKRLDFPSKTDIKTYDDALIKYGTPDSVSEGEKIFAATWSYKETRGAMVNRFGIVRSRGWELQLIFDKETKEMINWKYRRW